MHLTGEDFYNIYLTGDIRIMHLTGEDIAVGKNDKNTVIFRESTNKQMYI